MSFKPNPRAVRDLGDDPRLKAFMVTIGKEASSAAKDLAPVDTGRLRDSIGYKVEQRDGTWVVDVYFDKFYGLFHEFGTSRKAARPFLRPGVLRVISRRGGRLGDDGRR